MKISTRRFGTLEIPEDQIIRVPHGLIGFPDQKRYFFLEHRKGSPFVWFHSADEEDLAFVLIDPLLFQADYQVQVSGEDRKTLELSDSCEGLQTRVIVNISPGEPPEITANLLGPLLINPQRRLAKQAVLHQSSYSTRVPLPMMPK